MSFIHSLKLRKQMIGTRFFFGVLFLLLATAPALSWWGDGKEACLAAHSWTNVGRPLTATPDGSMASSVRPLLFTLSCLPTATLIPLPSTDESAFFRLIRAIPSSLFGAGCSALFFLISIRIGMRVRASMWLSLALIFATPLWVYSRMHYSESLQTFVNLCLLYLLIGTAGWERSKSLLAGFLAGVLINIRTTNVIVLPFLILVAMMTATHEKNRFRSIILIVAGFFPWMVAWMLFNELRFGSPWLTGYEPLSVWRSPLAGLYGQILSPGKSIFLYAPLAILGAVFFFAQTFGGKNLAGKTRKEEWVLFAFLVANIMLYSSWWAWGGGWAWGPRFLIPFIPVMLLPIAKKMAQFRRGKLGFLAWFLIAAGAAINVPVVLVGVFNLHQFSGLLDRAAFQVKSRLDGFSDDNILSHFVPDFSPVVVQFRLLYEMLTQKSDFAIDLSSWSGPLGNYQIPGFVGQKISFEKIWPDLWFLDDGGSVHQFYALPVALLLGLIGIFLLASISEGGSGSAADAEEARVRP